MTPAMLRAAAAVVAARADRGGLPHLHRIAEALLDAADRLTTEPADQEMVARSLCGERRKRGQASAIPPRDLKPSRK